MIIYLLIFLLFFHKIYSESCPETPGFLLAPNNQCFKIYHGRHGYDKVLKSCNQYKGILSGFVTDTETHSFNILIKKHYKKIKEKYVDRGFTCYNNSNHCTLNNNHNISITNDIEYLTDVFPCRGVMDIRKHTLHCINMTSEEDIIYACNKNQPYIKNCSNFGYEKYIDGNCYRIIGDFVVSKETAKSICKGESGTLPIITDYFQNHAINQLIDKIQHPIWLDFSCSTSDVSSCKWSTDEEMQINNIENFYLNDKNLCGYIKNSNSWGTDNCNTQKRIICQIKN